MSEINSRIHGYGVLFVPFVALVMIGGALSGCGDAGATIARLTVGAPGPDPYTVMLGSDRQQIAPSPQRGGERRGDQPGLYGGTRQVANCDPGGLVKFLQANPDKAKAWASVHKIGAGDISAFVGRLTPVLLRVDTLVTNHGYRNGQPTASPAVLQAGMGVMINQYGTPVVKCNCGNPLTAPAKDLKPRDAEYTGTNWPGFNSRGVTKIIPREASQGPVNIFVLVAPEGSTAFKRPTATDGQEDGTPTPLPPSETPVPTNGPRDFTPTPGTDDPSSPGGTPSDPVTPTDGTPTDIPTTENVAPSTPATADPQTPAPDPEPNGTTTSEPATSMAPPEEPSDQPPPTSMRPVPTIESPGRPSPPDEEPVGPPAEPTPRGGVET